MKCVIYKWLLVFEAYIQIKSTEISIRFNLYLAKVLQEHSVTLDDLYKKFFKKYIFKNLLNVYF